MVGQANAELAYDPFAKEVMSNPHPYYKRLRDEEPVFYIDKYDAFFISRYNDMVEMLSIGNNVLLASESSLPTPDYLLAHHNNGNPSKASTNPMAPGILLASPEYEEMRLAHIAPLRPKAVARIRELVRDLARERLKVLLPRGKFDLTSEYGGMVVAGVTCHLFGIPQSMTQDALDTVNRLTGFDPNKEAVDTPSFFIELKRFLIPAIEARRAAGADGSTPIIDGLIAYRTKSDRRALNDDEIADQLVCAFIANTETPQKVASHGLMVLAEHPDQLKAVRENLEENVPVAVEELVRYCAPGQWFMRTAHRDVTIAGRAIKTGQRVFGLMASAARDEREFENPDEFIWNRKIRRTLSFGFGQHHCIGRHLALLEIRTLVREFLSQVTSYRFDIDQAERTPSYFQWGWNKLPVVVTG